MSDLPGVPLAELGLRHPDVQLLSGGPLNRTLRLREGDTDLVVRLPHPETARLGVDHRAELLAECCAAAAGLAPAVVLARPETGLLVTRFVAGRQLGRDQLHDPAMLGRLGRWLARLHALPVPAGLPVVDFGERAAGYLTDLLAAGADGALRTALARLPELRAAAPPPAERVLCHHDLHHRNLIDTGAGLVAVDWEYAGRGDPAADLAACAGYHQLDAAQLAALLASYGPGAAAFSARLPALGAIFAGLCQGWEQQAGRLSRSPPA